jgi:hypothetical protein
MSLFSRNTSIYFLNMVTCSYTVNFSSHASRDWRRMGDADFSPASLDSMRYKTIDIIGNLYPTGTVPDLRTSPTFAAAMPHLNPRNLRLACSKSRPQQPTKGHAHHTYQPPTYLNILRSPHTSPPAVYNTPSTMTCPAQPRALISYAPHSAGGWKLQPVTLRPLREKELLVDVVASGICQTDLHFAGAESGFGVHYPRVMGHEGMYSFSIFCSLP